MKFKTKILFFFLFLGIGFVFAAEMKGISTMKADQIETHPDRKSISAMGNVEMIQGGKTFHADKIIYNQTEKTIEAEGRIKFKDPLGNKLFAEKLKVRDDIMQGNFYDAGVIFDNGSSITSPHINRESADLFRLTKPRYLICPSKLKFDMSYEDILKQTTQKKRNLFTIQSSKLKINKQENEMTFKHAIIKVWGVPIFYLPYLKTDDPLGDKQTGFEAPEIRHNSHYLYGLFLPYYIRISDSQNLRLKPGYYQKDNNLLEAYYNKHFNQGKDGFLSVTGSVINDNDASQDIENTRGVKEKDEGEYKDTRGYGQVETSYAFNDIWSLYGFGVMVSDDYVLRDYYQNYEEYIESFVDFDRINERNYNLLELKTLAYQEIREESTTAEEQTPQYVPIVNSHLETDGISKQNLKLTYGLDSNATALHRTTGLEYNRVTVTPSIENKVIVKGNVFKTKVSARGDFYHLEENYRLPDANLYKKDKDRVIMGFETGWNLPLITNVGKSSKFIFEPMVKYMLDSNQEDFERKIPNEDSQSAEISYSNIFAHNRYGGYDRVEYGNRVSYGINNELYNKKYGILNLFLAQGYRDENDTEQAFQIRGFEEDFSDVVGKASYDTKSIFDIYYRFRLDRTTFVGKSNEVQANFKFKRFRVFTNYAMLKADRLNTERQEQMTYGGNLYFLGKWDLYASATTDFVNRNKTISKNAGVHYEGPCTSTIFNISEYSPRSLKEPTVSFKINFAIKTSLF